LAFVAATAAGLAMARSRWARAILEPAVLIGLTVPGLVWALLAVIWFGLAQSGPVLAVALSAAPAIVLNVYAGARAVDPGLIEMAHVFRFDRRTRLTRLWLPALVPFLLSGARLGLSLAWKVIVLVEMFGASDGVGYQLNTAFSNQDVARVLAWTILFGVAMAILEYAVLRTIERRVTRWRKEAIV
jgi:NitT/TauT family transport system permease protein